MSYTNTVYTAMRGDCIYRVCDLAAATQLQADECRRVLKMLVKGGLVEEMADQGFKRKKLYKTKQRALF